MGNSLDKIAEGLFLGDIDGARDGEGMKKCGITHVVSLRTNMIEPHPGEFTYLLVYAENIPGYDISRHFRKCIDFIHSALLSGGSVLIHCMGGISRSPAVTCAYLMTATSLGLQEVLTALKKMREMVDPSSDFLLQLRAYEEVFLEKERKRLIEKFPDSADLNQRLDTELKAILSK